MPQTLKKADLAGMSKQLKPFTERLRKQKAFPPNIFDNK